jgi:sorting nexin-5/6/32
MMDGETTPPSDDEQPKPKPKQQRADTIDLETDTSLQVDISDALSEQEKVKFTVHTKTTLSAFKKTDFSSVREHEEFIWLHDRFVENEEYAGIIIPPAPPRPDFDEPRHKLAKLREGEESMTKEEYSKMKQELEAEYLATFKKTVAMHEVFLQRLASHPQLRADHNYQTFLEFEGDLSVRRKNTKERMGSLWKGFSKSFDESMVLKNHKDVDPWFEEEKKFLTEYHTALKDSTRACDKVTRSHKHVADSLIGVATYLALLSIGKDDPLSALYKKTSDGFEKIRKLEGRVASDEDLKLSDLLRYYDRNCQAALDLLYRRTRSLANAESANKKLETAKAKNKNVQEAEALQQVSSVKFDKLSETGKQELLTFKARRVMAFKKNLVDLTELEMKHAKTQVSILKSTLATLREL